MRVLLTTSPAPQQSPFFCNEKTFPLGLGFLLSVLRQAGHQVFFIDNFLHPRKFWTEGYLEKNSIDFVGIYSSTICWKGTLEIIEGCHKLRKSGIWNGKIVVGGPHTSVAQMRLPDAVDHIVRGEGEKAILDIVEGKTKERNVQGSIIEELDSLPRPAYDIFVNHHPKYENTVECFTDSPVFTMNTSRGCPFTCKFCSVQGVWGRRYRYFSPDRVIDDIQWLMKDFGAKGIYFREDNFTGNQARTMQFCEQLLDRSLNIKWLCETRVRPLKRDLLEMMARAGCRWLYLGCESGSQRILDKIDKRIYVQDIRNVINWGKELGIKCYTSWIVGIPGETEGDRQKTFKLIEELQPFSSHINVYIGLPGSDIYEEMIQTGNYIYKDELGLLYSADWNKLAARIPSYLSENKFCPVQSLPFKIYRVLANEALFIGRKHPSLASLLIKLSRSPLINRFNFS